MPAGQDFDPERLKAFNVREEWLDKVVNSERPKTINVRKNWNSEILKAFNVRKALHV